VWLFRYYDLERFLECGCGETDIILFKNPFKLPKSTLLQIIYCSAIVIKEEVEANGQKIVFFVCQFFSYAWALRAANSFIAKVVESFLFHSV